MKINLLFIVCFLFSSGQLDAQPPGGKIFKPVNYRTRIVGQDSDTTLPLQKVFVLTDDHFFYFKDQSNGSCWLWIDIVGKWQQYEDTLVLEWKSFDFNPDSTVLTTKYILAGDTLKYSDSNEENIVRNWGKFTLLKDVKNFKTDLNDDADIATKVRSNAAYLECIKRFKWTRVFDKKYNARYVLTSRRWYTREKVLKENKCEHLTLEEVEAVLDVYDTIWNEKQ